MIAFTPEFGRARSEVRWFFDGAESALGMRGAGSVDGVTIVWDSRRLSRLHLGHLSVTHRATVERYERVRDTIAALDQGAAKDLALVYRPFGSGRATWQAQSCFLVEGRQMLGLVLVTCEPVWRRYGAGRERLRWIEDEVADVSPMPGRALPLGHRLDLALQEACAREQRAITAYEALRSAREERREAERAETLRVALARTKERLG